MTVRRRPPFPPHRPRTPARDFEETRRRFPYWPAVLAEGDSWFSHPLRFNVLFQLGRIGGYAVRRIAASGDTLADMVRELPDRPPQYLRFLRRRRLDLRALLWSAGGNDLLGAPLPFMLRERRAARRPEDLLVETVVAGELAKIRTAYERVLERTATLRAGLPVLAHGYDVPFPRDEGATLFWGRVTVGGPWLQPVMRARGIDDPAEQRALARILVDRLNDQVLAPLAREHARFHHVDLRGLLPRPSDWEDEIHPTDAGFRRVALRIKERLDAVVSAS